MFLARRIVEAWGKPLNEKAIQKLNSAFGRVPVLDALRSLHAFPPEDAVRSPFAYIRSICENPAVSA